MWFGGAVVRGAMARGCEPRTREPRNAGFNQKPYLTPNWKMRCAPPLDVMRPN